MTATMIAPAVRSATEQLSASSVLDSDGRPTVYVGFGRVDGELLLLTCGEMALAMHHAGVRLDFDLTPDEVVALVLEGVARLGVDRVRSMSARSRAIVLRQLRDPGYDMTAEYRAIWPHADDRRHARSTGLACDLASYARGEPFSAAERLRLMSAPAVTQ